GARHAPLVAVLARPRSLSASAAAATRGIEPLEERAHVLDDRAGGARAAGEAVHQVVGHPLPAGAVFREPDELLQLLVGSPEERDRLHVACPAGELDLDAGASRQLDQPAPQVDAPERPGGRPAELIEEGVDPAEPPLQPADLDVRAPLQRIAGVRGAPVTV